jgi:malonyl-CoA decarboxylase
MGRTVSIGRTIPQPAAGPNARARLSAHGLEQSAAMMLNCRYDLARIATGHPRFVEGHAEPSRAMAALL